MKLYLQCLFMTVFFFASLAKDVSLVPAVCKKISQDDPENVNYEFCVSELELNPRSFQATAPQLAEISFQMGVSKAKAISSRIDELLKVPRSDPLATNALKNCSNLYSQVPDDLEAGLNDTKSGDFNAADAKVSDAMNAATACGNSITEKGDMSALAKENLDFRQLSAISHGFTNLLRIIN